MILLSMNLRVVGRDPKLTSLHRALTCIFPDILFIKETMVEEVKARALVTKVLPNWYCCGIDSIGRSGGLCVAWNPTKLSLVLFYTCAGILLNGTLHEGNQMITLINYYDPCTDRRVFWDTVFNSGILDTKNLILARDLKFTVSASEVWGSKARLGPLAEYFKETFRD